jgi:hypothetical protein
MKRRIALRELAKGLVTNNVKHMIKPGKRETFVN